jgi:hypothetical protein
LVGGLAELVHDLADGHHLGVQRGLSCRSTTQPVAHSEQTGDNDDGGDVQ